MHTVNHSTCPLLSAIASHGHITHGHITSGMMKASSHLLSLSYAPGTDLSITLGWTPPIPTTTLWGGYCYNRYWYWWGMKPSWEGEATYPRLGDAVDDLIQPSRFCEGVYTLTGALVGLNHWRVSVEAGCWWGGQQAPNPQAHLAAEPRWIQNTGRSCSQQAGAKAGAWSGLVGGGSQLSGISGTEKCSQERAEQQDSDGKIQISASLWSDQSSKPSKESGHRTRLDLWSWATPGVLGTLEAIQSY